MRVLPHPESLRVDLPSDGGLGGAAGSSPRPAVFLSLLHIRISHQNCLRSVLHPLDIDNNVLHLCNSGAWLYSGEAVTVLPRRGLPAAHFAGYSVSGCLVSPIFLGDYGYNVYFCWFDSESASEQFWLKIGYFFCPLWIFFFLEIYWAYGAYQKLKQVGLEGRELSIFKKILLFPIILVITGAFATADLIYIYVSGQFAEWLDIIAIVLQSTYGLFTSLVRCWLFRPMASTRLFRIRSKYYSALDQSQLFVRRSSKVSEPVRTKPKNWLSW